MVGCVAKNITLKGGTYYQSLGGFVGAAGGNATFTNCNVEGFVVSCSDTATIGGDIGGFASSSYSNVTFTGCSVTKLDMDLVSDNNGWGNGGFIGWQNSGNIVIDECLVSGEITVVGKGTQVSTGGFIGFSNNSDIEIKNCEANVTVSSNGTAGGIVGSSKGGKITDCVVTGSVTSTDGVASGMVGYINSGATITVKGNDISSLDINGVITNETVNSPDGNYELNEGGEVDFTQNTNVCCYGNIVGVKISFKSIQEAVNIGATEITLLQNSTESFTLDREESSTFTFNVGEFNYSGTITIPQDVKLTVKGSSVNNNIVLTNPLKEHYIFLGWYTDANFAEGTLLTNNAITTVSTSGTTYYAKWEKSAYVEKPESERTFDFGSMVYGTSVPQSQSLTFEYGVAVVETIATITSIEENAYFDTSFEGLNATIVPKEKVGVGSYKEIIHVTMHDGSTQEIIVKLVVNKAKISIPKNNETYVYNGSEQTYSVKPNEFYTVIGNKRISVGSQIVKISLIDKDNYEWVTGNSDDLAYTFTIKKAYYDMSNISFNDGEFVYNGQAQSIEITGTLPNGVTVEYDGNGKIYVGAYTVTAKFNYDTRNYYAIEPMTATLTINQSKVVDFINGNYKPHVEATTEGGFAPNVEIVITQVSAKNNKIEEVISAFNKVNAIYDISMIYDGVEVQPSEKTTIKLLIPEKLKNKNFKIYHNHNGEFTEIEYALQGDYAVFTVDKLSEFSFVYFAFPWWLVVIAVLVIASGITAGVVIYKRKVK